MAAAHGSKTPRGFRHGMEEARPRMPYRSQRRGILLLDPDLTKLLHLRHRRRPPPKGTCNTAKISPAIQVVSVQPHRDGPWSSIPSHRRTTDIAGWVAIPCAARACPHCTADTSILSSSTPAALPYGSFYRQQQHQTPNGENRGGYVRLTYRKSR